MRKSVVKFSIVSVALVFFLVSPKISYAVCDQVRSGAGGGLGACMNHPVTCQGIIPNSTYCCDTPDQCNNPAAYPPPAPPGSTTPPYTGPCAGLQGQPDFGTCTGCVSGGGAYTALGCIDTDPTKFIAWLLKNIIGIAGGLAFLLILYGGFLVLTSGGDPEKLNNGKDIIVSAIAGVLMIVFSILLLKIIGYDILKIPGFGVG